MEEDFGSLVEVSKRRQQSEYQTGCQLMAPPADLV
jgi:hypothetical protein